MNKSFRQKVVNRVAGARMRQSRQRGGKMNRSTAMHLANADIRRFGLENTSKTYWSGGYK